MSIILVVDDEIDIVDALSALLELEGYEVTTAGNGREGLQRIEEHRPDLILLDVMMPVMDGPEMLERLGQHSDLKRIPVIVMSAGGRPDALDRFGHPFISKPFELDELIRLVNRELKQEA